MKTKWVLACIFWISLAPAQQIADGVYWVYFTDKTGNGYENDTPLEFLSRRSIDRRAGQGLAVDLTDQPVTSAYLEEIEALGASIRHVSRWLNGIALSDADSALFARVLAEPFTDTIPWQPGADDPFYPSQSAGGRFEPPLDTPAEYRYGIASEQVTLLDVDILHQKGYTGRGVRIAVLDAGFRNVDSLPAFQTLISEGRLQGTRNFVDQTPLFRQGSTHGMYVLSIMASEWDQYIVGTAPHATYYLCMTENTGQETRIEEIAWIEAAEFIDSLGYDVINTSLGYSDFDGNRFDYAYRDMDGETTFISRASSMTADKGIIACSSAGNSGNDSWFYITAPADATGILTVGAVDSTNTIGGFSSRGPTFDARIKPDVTAMGVATGVQSIGGGLARGSGTSFASPLIAGSVACLWQAFPDLSAMELIRTIRQSGDRRTNPDATYGFGMPSFARAYWSVTEVPTKYIPWQMEVYPNPAQDRIMIRIPEEWSGSHELRFYDLSGRIVASDQVDIPGEVHLPAELRDGIYILEIQTRQGIYRTRLIKE